MNYQLDQLLLYRPAAGSLPAQIMETMRMEDEEKRTEAFYEILGKIADQCENFGFHGNMWHCSLTYFLAYHENAFSKACEIRGAVEGGINALAEHDFRIMMGLFHTKLPDLCAQITGTKSEITDAFEREYHCSAGERKLFNRRIRDRICDLAVELENAQSVESFKSAMEVFYKEFGVGKFGLHKAFRIQHTADGSAQIIPITNIAHVQLEDLVGYEIAKKKLIDNTEAFVKGRRANNCLLFGDAGTGKSSSIKAILNRYYDQGLRIIEVYKHQFKDLNSVIEQIKNRNYKFIIYMDDLSFEEFETEYKYLKAVIEGGLEKKPGNILIYATSNRRHLIRETYEDKYAGGEEIRQDMHTSDTVQEKLSLVYRFGVTIYFGSPDKKEFKNIVRVLAQRNNITMPEEELYREANKWELAHGGLSGRTAQQFIDYLMGSYIQ